jgi:hypothetical protein
MSVALTAFGAGKEVFISFPFEDVMLRCLGDKVFRKFDGETQETEVPYDSTVFREAILAGDEIPKAEYESGKTVKLAGGQVDQAPTDDSTLKATGVASFSDGSIGTVEKYSEDQSRVPAGGPGGGEFAGGGNAGGICVVGIDQGAGFTHCDQRWVLKYPALRSSNLHHEGTG